MLTFAILGAGGIAGQFVRAVRLTDEATIGAVASRSKERAEAFSKTYNIPKAYGNYEEMLLQPDIDVVYIATTHNYHYENIIACLNAGKHIICEKPMVLTEKDARACFDLAREKGLFLMEAMWSRCLPGTKKARAWIEEGRIGDICSASVSIGFRAPDEPEKRLLNPRLAGGALYDIGVYAIEVLSYLMGEETSEVLAFRRNHHITGVDTDVSFLLRYRSADACLQCTFSSKPKEFILINGTKGFIEIPSVNRIDKGSLYGSERNLLETFDEPYENGFTFEIEEAIRCIMEGKRESAVNPSKMTIECARVFDAILGK